MQEHLESIVDDIATDGWSVRQGFVAPQVVDELAHVARDLREDGAYDAAGIGRGEEHTIRKDIRGDRIFWLNPQDLDPAVVPYWNAVMDLGAYANRTLYLGIAEFEAHFAVYPPGAGYARHVDRFKEGAQRMLSCILYLNRAWEPGDGGELRIYPADGRSPVDVEPRAGTFVCMRSDLVEHEVLAAVKPRFSLTGWLRRPTLL